MNRKILGIIFIFVAILIIISNLSISGAVIGVSLSNYLSLVALVFFLIGAILLISERRQIEGHIEQLVASGVSRDKINSIQEIIRKHYNGLNREQRKEIYQEVASLMEDVQQGNRVGGKYNLHKLSVLPPRLKENTPSKSVLEGDAKVLNKYSHQGGKGIFRYILDNNTGELLGIAYHPRGNPRDLKWKVRF